MTYPSRQRRSIGTDGNEHRSGEGKGSGRLEEAAGGKGQASNLDKEGRRTHLTLLKYLDPTSRAVGAVGGDIEGSKERGKMTRARTGWIEVALVRLLEEAFKVVSQRAGLCWSCSSEVLAQATDLNPSTGARGSRQDRHREGKGKRTHSKFGACWMSSATARSVECGQRRRRRDDAGGRRRKD